MDKTFNFDLREFYGNNNSPKTQRLIESASKKPRRSRAEDVSLPDLEEYKPQITMNDIPRLRSAGNAPERDDAGEAKGRAIATGVAALLGILGGGDVARSAVAGYTGMKTGQDRIFASEEKSYLAKQKQLMDQFNSENKSFGNQLGLERLLQGGVNTRNQQKMGLTGLQMQQARAGDAAETAGLNLDLQYERLAQQSRRTDGKGTDWNRFIMALTRDPTVANRGALYEMARKQAAADGVKLPDAKFLSMTPYQQVTVDNAKKRIALSASQLRLASRRVAQGDKRLAMDIEAHPVKMQQARLLVERLGERNKLTPGQVARLGGELGDAEELIGEAAEIHNIIQRGKNAAGEALTPEDEQLLLGDAADLFRRGVNKRERVSNILKQFGIRGGAPGTVLNTRRERVVGSEPVVLSSGVKVTGQKPKGTPKPVNPPKDNGQKSTPEEDGYTKRLLKKWGLAK